MIEESKTVHRMMVNLPAPVAEAPRVRSLIASALRERQREASEVSK